MALLDSLNPEQREAVECTEGPSLVLAGAGSGKTRVITYRIAHMIANRGIPPERILAVTFTNKAAAEMRNRVDELLAANNIEVGRRPTVRTFHSFCATLLRQYGEPLSAVRSGFTTDFQILDGTDQLAIVRRALKQVPNAPTDMKPRTALGRISRLKTAHGLAGEGGGQRADAVVDMQVESLRAFYENELLAANALDFDDLLLQGVQLLETFPEVRERVRARCSHVLVDEYQDTNRLQLDLLVQLTREPWNLCVVGDDDQVIYTWRGADHENILRFEKHFAGAKTFRLEQNYRSTPQILDAAYEVISCNKKRQDKRLWTDRPSGDLPWVIRATHPRSEARRVVRAVGHLLDDDPGVRAAILYRVNAQSRVFEEELMNANRDYVVVAGTAFYQRAEVKDMLAYLRAAVVPSDAVSLRRIINTPARGIGKTTLERVQRRANETGGTLWEAIEDCTKLNLVGKRARVALEAFSGLMRELREEIEGGDLDNAIESVFRFSGYEAMLADDGSAETKERADNIHELIAAAGEADERGESMREFLDRTALIADTDAIDTSARILLMTLHSAKGLEFPAVAVVGVSDGLVPHRRHLGDAAALEEERRLLYVGMTRAQRHLILSCCRYEGTDYGIAGTAEGPSRFLDAIPPGLLNDPDGAIGSGGGGRGQFRQARIPDRRPERRSAHAGASIKTHDSVESVLDFFQKKRNGSVQKATPPSRESAAPLAGAPSSQLRSPSRLGRAAKQLRREGEFPRGTRVRHPKFGTGIVQRREGDGPSAKVSVYFRKFGLRKLIANRANLREI